MRSLTVLVGVLVVQYSTLNPGHLMNICPSIQTDLSAILLTVAMAAEAKGVMRLSAGDEFFLLMPFDWTPLK